MDSEMIESYLEHLQEKGARAWKTYHYQLTLFLRWLATKSLSLGQINVGVVNEYLAHRKHQGRKKLGTLKTDLSALRSLFRWARERGFIDGDPTAGIDCSWLDKPGGFPAYRGPLRNVLKKPFAILKHTLPLFAPFWEEYIGLLLKRGHSKSYIHCVLNHNFYFHQYLTGRKLRRFAQITPTHLDDFFRREGARFRKVHGRTMPKNYLRNVRVQIEGFLAHAFDRRGKLFLKPDETPEKPVLPAKLLARYMDFCRVHGGLSLATQKGYRRNCLLLRSFLGRRGIRKIKDVRLDDLDAFLLRHSKHMGARGLQAMSSAVRSFFRFLHLTGEIPCDLAQKILSPRRFRADLRPKYLPWKKVERLLDGMERNSRTGKRDYAILVLLACHGLRAREAASLKISDIDWSSRSFLLRERKNRTAGRIPMSQRTEQALRDYLSVRPSCSHPEVFLASRAPVRPLGRSLNGVAGRHLHERFGGSQHPGGAYVLRHSFAKALLDRGAKLHEIGSLLGHKSLRSTLIYTRIATEDMREVADNYAELL